MPNVRGRSVTVVGKRFGDNRNASWTVSFVVDFFDLERPFLGPASAGYRPLDILVRNVGLLRRRNRFGKGGIFGWIRSPLGGEGDELRVDRENLPAFFRVLFFLFLYDRSASHGSLVNAEVF